MPGIVLEADCVQSVLLSSSVLQVVSEKSISRLTIKLGSFLIESIFALLASALAFLLDRVRSLKL